MILAAADSTAVADVSIETQQAVEQFLYRQAEMLDEKRIDEWMALFGADGWYWMPAEAIRWKVTRAQYLWEDQGLMYAECA